MILETQVVLGNGVPRFRLRDPRTKTLGWRSTCACGRDDTVPCVVLDPFAGSGTTGAVAKALGRRSVLIEISGEYVELAARRLQAAQPALL